MRAKLLRLHFGEADRYQGRPLYEAIVEQCRRMEIAGATVFRGIEGYGPHAAEVHRASILSHDAPIVVSIVDAEENILRLLPVVESMMGQGLIAISEVQAVRCQRSVVG